VDSFKYFLQHPFLGIGIGNQWTARETMNMTGSTHNLYIETLLETGIVGFITLMGFLLGFLRNLYGLWKEAPVGYYGSLAAGLLTVLIVALINAFEEPSFWGVQFAYVFWMVMALGFALRRLLKEKAD
jgi:O-antigen ligase